MELKMMGMFGKAALVAVGLCALFSSTVLAGEKVVIKDITGRDVEVSVPVDNVILSSVSSAGGMICRRPTRKPMPPISPNTRRWQSCRHSAA
jgi:ABC-type Fe3+-hydroxamate transport system substrate-binding protein